MLQSQHSVVMVGRVGVAGRGEEGQVAGPLLHSSRQHASGFT